MPSSPAEATSPSGFEKATDRTLPAWPVSVTSCGKAGRRAYVVHRAGRPLAVQEELLLHRLIVARAVQTVDVDHVVLAGGEEQVVGLRGRRGRGVRRPR